MSKRLLSAILAIAMVASLCASVFTVGTSAAASYEADRAALKAAIYNLFVKGPELAEETRDFLVDAGILKDVCDKCDVTDGELERAKVYKIDMPACEKNHANGTYVCSEAYVGEYDEEALNTLVIEAASAYYFGQKADELLVDASFNSGRNAIVKEYTKLINDEMKALTENIGAFVEGKPGYVENEDYEGYAKEYADWIGAYHNGAYNPNFGINPYAKFDEVLGANNWQDLLFNYANAGKFPLWHSFDEMRADSTVAPLLVKFERLYREAQSFSAKGMLFYDFVAKKAELENAWNALIAALLAKYTWTATVPTVSAKEAIVAFNGLGEVVDFYDLYIADAYINVYTSANTELLKNIAIAKLVREFVKSNGAAAAYTIGAAYFNNLKDALLANIAALDPAAARLNLTAEDIALAIALVKDAQTLLNAYAIFANKDGYKVDYAELQAAIANVKVMIPYDSESACVYTIPANSADGVADLAPNQNNVIKENAAIDVVFMPNYFALIRFMSILEKEIADMMDKIEVYNDTIAELGNISNAAALSKEVLKNALYDLDFLAGHCMESAVCDNFYDLYTENLAAFIEEIVSSYRGDAENIDDDQAFTQFATFVDMYEDAKEVYEAADPTVLPEGNQFAGLGFATSAWDWATESFVGEKNSYGKVAEALYAFLPYLTASLEQIINFYAFIAEVVANHFGVVSAEATAYAAGDLFHADAFINGAFDTFAKAALQLLVNCEINVSVGSYDIKKGNVTATSLKANYEAFIKATKNLLTDRGIKLLDQFIADVQAWISVNYKKTEFDNKHELYEKLVDMGMDKAFALSADVAEPYLYYNFTLTHVANCLDEDVYAANKYVAGEQFTETIYNPLVNKLKLASEDKYYIADYDRDWSADFVAIREKAGQLSRLMDETGEEIISDVPLYYVLNMIAALDDIVDSANDHHVDTLAAYKAEVLLPVLAASELNKFDFDTTAETFAAVWAAYEAAYNTAIAAKYDTRLPKADIDDAVANLVAAVAALADYQSAANYTVADLEAIIVEGEALLVRADMAKNDASVASAAALKDAITAAKKFIVNYKYDLDYNNEFDVDGQVFVLQSAIYDVEDKYYFADDLTAYLTIIAANAAGYEAMNTAESYAALVLAFSNALEVAQNANLNASAYIAAADAVKAAEAALVAKPAPVEPEAPAMTKTFEAAVAKLAELKEVSTEGFTAETVSAFNEAVARLEIAIKTVAEDDVLLEFIANAYIAKAQLATIVVENPTTCD